MKAARVTGFGQPLEVRDVTAPSIGDRDVLVRVGACGVCHGDLQLADGFFAEMGMELPLVLGHETAGVIEEVGNFVADLRAGDRIVVYMALSCGQCRYCAAGEDQACPSPDARITGFTVDGGYAEYIKGPADHAIPLPDKLDFATAAPLACAGLTAYHGLKNGGLRPGQRVAVLGIGGLGHLAIQLARAMDAEVIAITSSGKTKTASELGAHHVIDRQTGDVGEQLQELVGADVILETTLDPGAIMQVMQGLSPQGTLVLTTIDPTPIAIVPVAVAAGEQRIVGTRIGSRQDLQELVALAAQHGIRPLTERYGIDEVNAVHDRLRANEVRFRAVLTAQ